MNSEIYDTLKAVADQYGGVGHSRLGDYVSDDLLPLLEVKLVTPCCIWGLIRMLPLEWSVAASAALLAAGVTPVKQDNVFTPTERADRNYRLPFEEWAQRLGVTRG